MFWIHKFFTSSHKLFLLRKIWKLKSFRYIRELYYSIKHPEEQDIINLSPLSRDSKRIVFVDIGAFEGDFATAFTNRYPKARGYLIEPVEEFVDVLLRKFSDGNHKIIQKGLTSEGAEISLSDLGASSSSMTGQQVRKFQSMSVDKLGEEIQEEFIDLFQINCEGGEYEILPKMIESGMMERIYALNIQYHYMNPKNILKRQQINRKLSRTHKLIWSVWFIWERWEKR
jgi:FkbM family methyltransferase